MSSSTIEALTEDNQTRMASILEACLLALEQGERIEPQQLLAANPDLAEPLGKCLTTLMSLHAAVHGHETLPAHELPEVGGQLGEFVIEELIGRGGMGSVYRASQSSLSRQVALKILPNTRLLAPNQLQRFQLEARAVAQLHHPHIVPIYSVGQQGDVHFYAMQLIAGQSLDKLEDPLWAEHGYQLALQCAIDLCDALQHAHSVGIIHRDIKPANLILDQDGQIWITDFGLAQCRYDTRLTTSGDLVGTINYMSPEQALGKPLDERTDIYSLGATLYEMLTGQQAFPGQMRAAALRAIQDDDPLPLRKLKTSIPYDLETVVLKAMSKDREARYASMQEMADDLRRIQQGLPILGRRPTWPQRVSRWVVRHRLPVWIAAAGIGTTSLALVVGAAFVLLTRHELHSVRRESNAHLRAAEQNYWQGRNLVEHWNRDIVSQLAEVPGAEDLHAQMLRDTVEYYRACIRDWEGATGDPRLFSDLITARCGLASALEQSGYTQEAIAAYEQALDELQRRADRSPADRLRAAITHNDLAVVLLHQQQTTEALEHLQQALDELNSRSWSELSPYSVNLRSSQDQLASTSLRAAIEVNRARTHQTLGNRTAEAAALNEAEAAYRLLLAAERPTTSAKPSGKLSAQCKDSLAGWHYQSELATVLDQRALLFSESNLEQAIELSVEAVQLHRACCDQLSPALSWLTRLGASQHNLAVLRLRSGQDAAAKAAFLDAIESKYALVGRTGGRPTCCSDLALSYQALGQMLQRWGDLPAAGRALGQAQTLLEQAMERHPDPQLQRLLAEVRVNLTQVAQSPNDSAAESPVPIPMGAGQ